MRTQLALLLSVAALALGGCSTASLTAEGAKVAPTRDPLPESCQNVGLVTGKGGGTFGGGMVSNEDLIEYAMNDIRNKTAELGGTHVRTDPPQLGSGDGTTTSVTITGTAYKCPGAAGAASGVRVIENF
ncbi:MAG: DUF4156 domain-containing protein [Polyangiaceae bacterium]|nr:DUF4156 domain-containing protein [Polyangiaceae bacterium]MCB9606680.1 DUF4156 domain-containing protein [Polyangiaceae bacterium]